MVLPWTTLYCVGDIKDRVILHMIFMSIKANSQNNELRLVQEVTQMCSKMGLVALIVLTWPLHIMKMSF